MFSQLIQEIKRRILEDYNTGNVDDLKSIARHYYQRGLNARKEE